VELEVNFPPSNKPITPIAAEAVALLKNTSVTLVLELSVAAELNICCPVQVLATLKSQAQVNVEFAPASVNVIGEVAAAARSADNADVLLTTTYDASAGAGSVQVAVTVGVFVTVPVFVGVLDGVAVLIGVFVIVAVLVIVGVAVGVAVAKAHVIVWLPSPVQINGGEQVKFAVSPNTVAAMLLPVDGWKTAQSNKNVGVGVTVPVAVEVGVAAAVTVTVFVLPGVGLGPGVFVGPTIPPPPHPDAGSQNAYVCNRRTNS
jgi:hypothetical protein